MIEIRQITSVTDPQFEQLQALMGVLSHTAQLTRQVLSETMQQSCFFAAFNDEQEIVGCATLCLFTSPTGRKASVEDVVVSPAVQGQGIGRLLMQTLLDEARRHSPITVQLTSRPSRIAANRLYPSMGFQAKETNFYYIKL